VQPLTRCRIEDIEKPVASKAESGPAGDTICRVHDVGDGTCRVGRWLVMAADGAADFRGQPPAFTKNAAEFCMICAECFALIRKKRASVRLCGDLFQRFRASESVNCEFADIT
jgi:hypothetical protein